MKWLCPVLLIGVFARHNLTWLPGYSPAEWFYVMGGLWEIILCLAILFTLPTQPLLSAAMWIGILEGGQVAVCGALMGHARPPPGVNECDHIAGLPIGATMTGLYAYVVVRSIAIAWHGALGVWHEIGLGVAMSAVILISGNEIAYLINPWAAILVMAVACFAGTLAYGQAK